jgi:hypothetical protein
VALYEYAIGTSVATLVNMEVLAANTVNVPPRGLAVDPVSVRRVGADGHTYGDGFPQTEWRFDIITGAQLQALLEYLGGGESATVTIKTRLDDLTYATYRAVMHRPVIRRDMEPDFLGRWKDVTIKFTMLEAVS